MSVDLKQLLRWDEARRDKPRLVIPAFKTPGTKYDPGVVTNELRECARVIRERGGLFRWKRFTGLVVLVVWDPESKQFTGFDTERFGLWLGAFFDLCDRSGLQFGRPHLSTASRLWEQLTLDESGLPWASWQLTDEYRRAGK